MKHALIFSWLCLVCSHCTMRITSPTTKPKKTPLCVPSTCQVLNESQLNQKHREGFAKGEQYGFSEGYQSGFKAGKAQGFTQGHQKGQLAGQLMAYDYINKLFNPPFLRGGPEHRSFAKMMAKTIRAQFREKGRQDALKSLEFQKMLRDKYKEGQDDCFQQTYRANLRLGQQINPKLNPADKPLIKYEWVVAELKGIRGNYGYASPATFSKVLRHVHKEILGYIARLLEENEDLIDDKIGHKLNRKEVFQEYDRLHEALAAKYYRQYIKGCRALNIHYQKSFYNHAIYFATDLFISIVNAGICALADTILTYVKSNTQYAAITGFETLGNICELITAQVVTTIADKLKKRALYHDFNENRPHMVQSIAQSLKEVVVAHRTYEKEAAESTIYQKTPRKNNDKKDNYQLDLKATLGIRAVASIGIDVSQIHLIVDEQSQTITVHIPDAPQLLDIVHQGYWVKSASLKNAYKHQTIINQTNYVVSKSGVAPPNPPPTRTTRTQQLLFTISPKRVEAIFQQNQFEPYELQSQLQPLRTTDSGLAKVRHILKKVIEPMIVLPSSCYTVYMVFKGQLSKVHEVSCR